jgi:hypothetical protein
MTRIDRDAVEAAVMGGCLLGGGGGGAMEEGRRIGRLAVETGIPRLAGPDELSPDAVVVTVSAVGAPAAAEQFCTPMHYVRAVRILSDGGLRIGGLITSENGGLASVNGWFQSAVLDVPVVDAPCNGRAHPMGTMGAIGLHRLPDYVSRQAAAGGNPDLGKYTEISVAAGIVEASRLVRQAAISAGGMVAVARNPVLSVYARENAAPGALTLAINLGRRMLEAAGKKPDASARAAAEFLGGDVVAEGEVETVGLETKGGFDVGKVTVAAGSRRYELPFWNEYMALDLAGERLATFPDLIATVDLETGNPLPTAAVRKGNNVAVLRVPREKLILGAGMRDPELLGEIEKVLEIGILKFIGY